MTRPPSALRARLWRGTLAALLGVVLSACSGGTQVVHKLDPDKIKLGKPRHQAVRGTKASLEVPEGFERVADRVWAVKQRGGLVMVLNVVRTPAPKGGLEIWLRMRIQAVQRSGQAGITRNDAVELGDLDGRYVEAVEVVGQHRRALFLVAAETEDGVYVASVYMPVSLYKRFGAAVATTVKSLRVAR